MSIRFKLDRCGIKLSLRQWSRFAAEDRNRLLRLPCEHGHEVKAFRRELEELIERRSTEPPQYLPIEVQPDWADPSSVPEQVVRFAAEVQVSPPSLIHWAALSPLQRFVLIKLSRAKHDNVNFVPAMREFGLID